MGESASVQPLTYAMRLSARTMLEFATSTANRHFRPNVCERIPSQKIMTKGVGEVDRLQVFQSAMVWSTWN
jgi:hypothetical protein